MSGIFSFNYTPAQIGITVITNIVATGILTFALTKVLGSEKAMF